MSTEETVLVEALVDIEHDRQKHVPGTKSAQFLVPESALESLVRSGAVKKAAVFDADALLVGAGSAAAEMPAVNDKVVTFADAAEHFELERVRAELQTLTEALAKAEADYAAAHAERVELGQALSDAQSELVTLRADLAEAQAALEASVVGAADGASTGDAPAGDAPAADANAAAAAEGDTTKATTGKASKASKA